MSGKPYASRVFLYECGEADTTHSGRPTGNPDGFTCYWRARPSLGFTEERWFSNLTAKSVKSQKSQRVKITFTGHVRLIRKSNKRIARNFFKVMKTFFFMNWREKRLNRRKPRMKMLSRLVFVIFWRIGFQPTTQMKVWLSPSSSLLTHLNCTPFTWRKGRRTVKQKENGKCSSPRFFI